MTKIGMLDSTVHKTHEWLRDVSDALGLDDERAAYSALRATLHGLRDMMSTDQVALFGAQLPTLVRGVYYEGWNPAGTQRAGDRRRVFLEAIRHEMREHIELRDAERVARLVFGVMAIHVAPGETEKIVRSLAPELRDLWAPLPVLDTQ